MAETVGLDIGSHSIKLVGLKRTPKGPFLTCFGMRNIPQGIDKEDLVSISEVLKGLIEEMDLKTRKVRLTVSGSGIQIRRVTLPSIPKKEINKALAWEIKDHLPFPVETARVQFHILGEFNEEGIKKLDLLAVACPDELINRTLSILNLAGLEPEHLDVGAFALWNTLIAWDRLKIGETVALIDLGSEKMSLHLFKDEILQFSREMTPAGDELTRAIADGIPFEKDLALLHEKAERIKEALGISPGPHEETGKGESIDLSKITFLMRPVLEKWAGEIGRSLDYYRHQFYGERIDKILLTGGGAHLKNFSSFLEGELKIPVEHFNPLKETFYDPKRIDVRTRDQMGSMFTTATGVALSYPKRVEFLPAKEPFWTKLQNEKWILGLTLSATVLAFLLIIWWTKGQVASLQGERDEKVAKVATLEELRSKVTILREREVKLKQDLSLFPPSTISAGPHREILMEVSKLIPGNVTLTHLEIQSMATPSEKASGASKPQEGETQKSEKIILHISGLAFGNDVDSLTALARIIEGLERSPRFSHAKLVSTGENKLYNRLAIEFNIACNIDPLYPSQDEEKGKRRKP